MKTEKGKSIPVDRLKFIATGRENATLLDKNGVIHRGAARGVAGWRPHWESCPNAGEFRKGGGASGATQ
ncbi:MAG: hypothetical protein F9K15_12860 [Zoogloea sp.]|nr:MAG: hypothetical protein F9K15_12860 [Zoogloea sp.]